MWQSISGGRSFADILLSKQADESFKREDMLLRGSSLLQVCYYYILCFGCFIVSLFWWCIIVLFSYLYENIDSIDTPNNENIRHASLVICILDLYLYIHM